MAKSKGQLSLFDDPPRPSAPPGAPSATAAPSGAVLPDADARAFATDPRHNVVLEASAGTGKTSVLVQRYLGLLAAEVDPANILAITFTRKAAAEMRERIVRQLRAAATRSEKDRARWRELRDRLGDIAISTIDAFCLSLLREFPLEADLDPGFGMADETEVPRLMADALDHTVRVCFGVAREDPDVALVLARLGASRARAGLEHLLERRLVAPAALDRFVIGSAPDLTAEAVCRRAIAALRDLLRGATGGMDRFLATAPAHPRFAMLARDLRRLDEDELVDGDAATIRGVLERVREHFLTQGGDPRRGATLYSQRDFASKDAWQRHHDAVLELAPRVADALARFDRDLNVVLARGVRRMFAIADTQYGRVLERRAAVDFTEALRRALLLLQQMDEFAQSRYRLEARYHHVLVDEFQDTSRAQWGLVSLLIQSWGEGLGLAADSGLQPSVFIVGDRKQSIYRFRDADASVLDEASAYIAALRPQADVRRTVTHSFRAVPGLLLFTNDLFAAIDKAPERRDAFRFDERDRFPVPEEGPDAAADLRPALGVVADDQLEACAEAVAAEIARLLDETSGESLRDPDTGVARKPRPGDFAILFRSRESHREFEQALEARGIPAYVYKGLGFFDADEIKDLTALLRYLANPTSDLRAAALLRSRLVRVSDEALSRLAPGLAAALTAGHPPSALAALGDDDRRALAQLRASLPRWLGLVDRVTPAELVDLVLAESAYMFELRGPRVVQARENVKKMRGVIRRIQNRGYATLAGIAEHLQRLSAGDESNAVVDAHDAVSLMTVHAAKGLEFPVVFVVNLARGTGGPPPPIRVAPDPGDGEPSVSVGSFASDADEDERTRDREETKRLLYVALTRARDRLYLSAVLKDGEFAPWRGSLGEGLPASFTPVFERAARDASGAAVGWAGERGRMHQFRVCRPPSDAPSAKTAPELSAAGPADDFTTLEARDRLPRITVTGHLARRNDVASAPASGAESSEAIVGTLVHRLFQTGAAEFDPIAIRRRAARLLRADERAALREPEALLDRAAEAYVAIRGRADVTALLAGERFYEVPFSLRFDPPEATRARPGADGPVIVRGSIDCVVRHADGRVTVVELKTGTRRPEHQIQLEAYVEAASVLFPGAAVDGVLVYA